MDGLVLVVSLVVILVGAELFTNGVEWFGKHFDLAEGAVGSVLAAVGTALPETMIPLIAIVFTGGITGAEIGVGAILGAPFMLATLAMFVTGVAIVAFGSGVRRALRRGSTSRSSPATCAPSSSPTPSPSVRHSCLRPCAPSAGWSRSA